MPLALNVIRKKNVLCSAEKSFVIWAEPHSRSLAKLFSRTGRSVGHYLEDNSRNDAPDHILEPSWSVAEHIRGAKVAEFHCLKGAEDHRCVTKHGDRVDVTELFGNV